MSPSWVTIQLGNGDENENFKRVNEEMRKDITRISAGNGKAGKVVDIRDIERRGGKKKNGGGSRQQNMGAQQNQCLDMANYPHPNFSHPNPSTGKAKKKVRRRTEGRSEATQHAATNITDHPSRAHFLVFVTSLLLSPVRSSAIAKNPSASSFTASASRPSSTATAATA